MYTRGCKPEKAGRAAEPSINISSIRKWHSVQWQRGPVRPQLCRLSAMCRQHNVHNCLPPTRRPPVEPRGPTTHRPSVTPMRRPRPLPCKPGCNCKRHVYAHHPSFLDAVASSLTRRQSAKKFLLLSQRRLLSQQSLTTLVRPLLKGLKVKPVLSHPSRALWL